MTDDTEPRWAETWAEHNRVNSTIPHISYYRQAGGCIEATHQHKDIPEVDILHFCSDDDARTFLREFNEFLDSHPPHLDLPPRDVTP